jgi:CO/xanthine dehydrogenase Mo-binding subunit
MAATFTTGKVDLGQGLRIAIPQMAAEELGIGVERIVMIEGDTALTPDQGATAGSSGIMRGGVQIRQAAATAREALIGLAATRAGRPATEFDTVDGEVRPKAGGAGVRFGDLIGDKRFGVKVDAKAKLRDPASYTVVGKPLARPDIPGKVAGTHIFVHDFRVDDAARASCVPPWWVRRSSMSTGFDQTDRRRTRRASRISGVVATGMGRDIGGENVEGTLVRFRDLTAPWCASGRAGPFTADETLRRRATPR